MTTTMKLVDRGQPRRLSGQEIQELTGRRVAARIAWAEEERRRLAEERAMWRRSGARRRRFWFGVVFASVTIGLYGLAWLMKTETQAALLLVASLVCLALSVRFAR